jgi:hypothetical protein
MGIVESVRAVRWAQQATGREPGEIILQSGTIRPYGEHVLPRLRS